MLGAIASGTTRIRNLSSGADVCSTARSLRGLGVTISQSPDTVTVTGTSDSFTEPDAPLDLGNAGTGIRLMCGLVAGRPMLCVLTGDASLRSRPMARVLDPLTAMGARFASRRGGLAPLVSMPAPLSGITYRPPVASAQVKSAILLAGLRAQTPTTVTEPVQTRPHTEEMLAEFGARVEVRDGTGTGTGSAVTVWPSLLTGTDVDVPGDPSQAAFWIVAACILPDSDLYLPNVERSPSRTGFIPVLRRMGADLTVDADGITVRHTGRLQSTRVDAKEVPALIDELPVLAVAAASANGESMFQGVGELVHKESDRLAGIVELVSALGATATTDDQTLTIRGTEQFRAIEFKSRGDHRMAMSAAIGALAAPGESLIHDVACVDTSYPGFFTDLEALTD